MEIQFVLQFLERLAQRKKKQTKSTNQTKKPKQKPRNKQTSPTPIKKGSGLSLANEEGNAKIAIPHSFMRATCC